MQFHRCFALCQCLCSPESSSVSALFALPGPLQKSTGRVDRSQPLFSHSSWLDYRQSTKQRLIWKLRLLLDCWWKLMVTRRKDVCFPGQLHPAWCLLPTSWKPPNKLPHLCRLVETGKKNIVCVRVASCNNRRPRALNNKEGVAAWQTN